MKTKIFKGNERGTADHGWLKANFSFSFANYFNPEKVNFGALRVLMMILLLEELVLVHILIIIWKLFPSL